jgi:hypothetical protein
MISVIRLPRPATPRWITDLLTLALKQLLVMQARTPGIDAAIEVWRGLEILVT